MCDRTSDRESGRCLRGGDFHQQTAALSAMPGLPPELGVATAPGLGFCEVISYSDTHDASLATIGVERSVCIEAIGAEAADLLEVDGIQYVAIW